MFFGELRLIPFMEQIIYILLLYLPRNRRFRCHGVHGKTIEHFFSNLYQILPWVYYHVGFFYIVSPGRRRRGQAIFLFFFYVKEWITRETWQGNALLHSRSYSRERFVQYWNCRVLILIWPPKTKNKFEKKR